VLPASRLAAARELTLFTREAVAPSSGAAASRRSGAARGILPTIQRILDQLTG
jgi:hypothetical protein